MPMPNGFSVTDENDNEIFNMRIEDRPANRAEPLGDSALIITATHDGFEDTVTIEGRMAISAFEEVFATLIKMSHAKAQTESIYKQMEMGGSFLASMTPFIPEPEPESEEPNSVLDHNGGAGYL